MLIPDRPSLLAAVVLLITAAFVASQFVRPPYGIWWRRAVILGYLIAIGIALILVARWLLAGARGG